MTEEIGESMTGSCRACLLHRCRGPTENLHAFTFLQHGRQAVQDACKHLGVQGRKFQEGLKSLGISQDEARHV